MQGLTILLPECYGTLVTLITLLSVTVAAWSTFFAVPWHPCCLATLPMEAVALPFEES